MLASDGFMLNFVGVMYALSNKITIDKVNSHYLFHSACRLNTDDIARMKLTSEQLKQYQQEIGTSLFGFLIDCLYSFTNKFDVSS